MAEAAAVLSETVEQMPNRYEMYRAYEAWLEKNKVPETPESFVEWDRKENGCRALNWNKTKEQAWLDDLREQARLFIVSYSQTRIYEGGQSIGMTEKKWNGSEFRSTQEAETAQVMIGHYER